MIDRRTLMVTGAAMMASPALAAATKLSGSNVFPQGFLWGAATAGHQVEGNNVASDQWFLENIKPSIYAEPSRDAANSFALWGQDMDLAKGLGLNCYRFSIEWARIEPEPGLFSVAMLDHYKRMIEGAHARGLKPVVTFNHFAAPRWFGAMGGWANKEAIELFARFCDKAARHLADGISHAITINEPNILAVLKTVVLPPQVLDAQKAMLAEAARRSETEKFTALNAANMDDVAAMQVNLISAHKAAKAAIKAVRSNLPVGVSLSMFDDQAVGKNSIRDAKRKELYGNWLDAARTDDFIGVQNYERNIWDDKGKRPAPKGAPLNYMNAEVYAPSLAGAARYAHEATGVPIFVTEHGVGTTDDTIRAQLIPAALTELKKTIDAGVPVIGYCHWSLIDNFEWIFGNKVKFGLHSVDPVTFVRTAKPSAAVYGAIAARNAV